MIKLEQLHSEGLYPRCLYIYVNEFKPFSVTQININIDNKKRIKLHNKLINDFGFTSFYKREERNKTRITWDFLMNRDKELLIEIGHEECSIYHSDKVDKEYLKKLEKKIISFKKRTKRNKIHIVTKSSRGFSLQEFDSKKIVIEEDAYEMSNFTISDIKDLVEDPKSGLILFSGPPGTGKTSLLRYLCNMLDQKFVFVPNEVASNLTDPGFLSFAMEELKNSILIIEDAENCITDRKSGNSTASVLLNVTDGLLGDLLGLKVIATINNEDLVDKALLRKGRLLAKVEFKNLPVEKAKRLAKKLNKTGEITSDLPLCDIYNMDIDNGVKETNKIGFAVAKL